MDTEVYKMLAAAAAAAAAAASAAAAAAAAAAASLQSCPTLCNPMDSKQPTRLLCTQESPGKNTGVGCHFQIYV